MKVCSVIRLSFALLPCVFTAGAGRAASCDGLSATVYIQELPVGRTACDSAVMLVFAIDGMSGIQARSEIVGCTGTGDISFPTADLPRTLPQVYVRTQIDREFAASSSMDGFDLGKRLWAMRSQNPAIKRVEVCRDVTFARP